MHATPSRHNPSVRLSRYLRILDAIDQKVVMVIVALGLVAMAFLISADAFYRYALNDSLDFVPKVVTKLLMVLVISVGSTTPRGTVLMCASTS